MKFTRSFWQIFLIVLPSAVALAQTAAVNSSAAQPSTAILDKQSDANLSKIRYVISDWNWQQLPPDDLSTAGNLTIHLRPCPLGLDTASKSQHYEYKVYIAGTGTPEAVPVTGGNCRPGAASGTIIVSTKHEHKSGYSIGSASSGIQEAWNDAWVSDIQRNANSAAAPYVKLMAGTNYFVHSSVYMRGIGSVLDGLGAYIVCSTRDRCINVGNLVFSRVGTQGHKIYNVTGGSTVNVDGVQISSVSQAKGIYTFTSVGDHPFVVGDTVSCEYHSQTTDAHQTATITQVPTSNTFQYVIRTGTFSAGAQTFGFCALENAFIEDNSDHVTLQDITVTQLNPISLGFFSQIIVNDNDQQLQIDRASNRGSSVIKNTANWPMGAFLYQRNDQGNEGISYIHNSEFTNINCSDAGGNGFVFENSVCQGFPLFGSRYFGGLQPSTFSNIYQESTGGTMNPIYNPSVASQMGILLQGGSGHRILGTFPVNGFEPTFASGGATTINYFVVPHSSTQGYGPVLFIGQAQPGSSSVQIPVQWPSIDLRDGKQGKSLGTLTWDLLETTGINTAAPYGTGNFAVAVGISDNCNNAGICSFTDTQAGTSSYTVKAMQFYPAFWFWPTNLALNNTTAYQDVVLTNHFGVASQGTSTGLPAIVALHCQSQNAPSQRSPIITSCLTTDNPIEATLFNNFGTIANTKGRINFGANGAYPTDILTLADSNFAKTVATAGERPSNDAGDSALGADRPGGLSQRAAASISSYIGTAPNAGGTNFQERLTESQKIFNVPVVINAHLDQSSSGNLGGKCSMSSSTSCTFKLSTAYAKGYVCIPAVQGSAAIAGACSVSGLTVTITAGTPNSQTWGALIIGNPN